MNAESPQDAFTGDPGALDQFLALARSEIRSPQRTEALNAWREFKARRARELFVASHGEPLLKGWTMEAMRQRLIDLSGINLDDAIIGYVDLRGVRLDGASLRGAWMKGAEFEWASLKGANLSVSASGRFSRFLNSDFSNADLRDANCDRADFSNTSLYNADLRGADFRETDLTNSNLVESRLQGTNMAGSRVYGVSAWNVQLCEQRTLREDLVVTNHFEPEVRVDNLEVAQFIYLLLNNQKLRGVIDTITSKVVLIVGRFSEERKPVLDAIRDTLRQCDYTPVMFDFSKPASKDYIGTVKTLAGLSKFIIADITDAKVVLQELESIVKEFPAAPVQPLLLQGQDPATVVLDFMQYSNFMPIFLYSDVGHLVASIKDSVVLPAEAKYREIQLRREEAERALSMLKQQAAAKPRS
jgi:uncharacterized protein YjbI with pentapeptide repeats